jgi:hypothetical protein
MAHQRAEIMFGSSWNVHLRVPIRGGVSDEPVALELAREAGQLLDHETMAQDPLRIRFAYLRKHEAERLFAALRARIPHAVVWLEMEQGLGIAD